eukprot:751570-Hanusia_phi.AAC.2
MTSVPVRSIAGNGRKRGAERGGQNAAGRRTKQGGGGRRDEEREGRRSEMGGQERTEKEIMDQWNLSSDMSEEAMEATCCFSSVLSSLPPPCPPSASPPPGFWTCDLQTTFNLHGMS